MSTNDKILDGLNPEQRKAVLHTEGPLLILAGAGSGKTRVLTHRLAWLVREEQVPAPNLLAITFTNKAAEEMRRRLQQLVGNYSRAMWASTFHAACMRILRKDAERLSYQRNFVIYDEDDQKRLVNQLMRDNRLDTKRYPPRMVRSRISTAKNEMVSWEDFKRDTTRRLRFDGGGGLPHLPGDAHPQQRHGLRRHPPQRPGPAGAVPGHPGGIPGEVPLHQRRRVPGHQPRPVQMGQPAGGRPAQPLRGGRRRPEHLLVARGRPAQHPRLREGLPRRHGHPPGAQLPLHPGHPGGGARRGQGDRGAQAQKTVDRPGRGVPHQVLPRRDQHGGGPLPGGGDRQAHFGRRVLPARHRRFLPRQRAVAHLRGDHAPLQPPLQDHRGLTASTSGARSRTSWPT